MSTSGSVGAGGSGGAGPSVSTAGWVVSAIGAGSVVCVGAGKAVSTAGSVGAGKVASTTGSVSAIDSVTAGGLVRAVGSMGSAVGVGDATGDLVEPVALVSFDAVTGGLV